MLAKYIILDSLGIVHETIYFVIELALMLISIFMCLFIFYKYILYTTGVYSGRPKLIIKCQHLAFTLKQETLYPPVYLENLLIPQTGRIQ